MKYLIKGILYDPIKMGDPEDWGYNHSGTCHDCGASHGEYHTNGCDMERCPCCGGQMISCDCGAVYIINKQLSKSELSELIKKQEIQTEADNLYIKNYFSNDKIIYDSEGESGNIFFILAEAKNLFNKKNLSNKFNEMVQKVCKANSYEDALKIINEQIKLVDISKISDFEL